MIGMVCITLLLTGCRDYDRQTVQYINLPYQEEAEEIIKIPGVEAYSLSLWTEEDALRFDFSAASATCGLKNLYSASRMFPAKRVRQET